MLCVSMAQFPGLDEGKHVAVIASRGRSKGQDIGCDNVSIEADCKEFAPQFAKHTKGTTMRRPLSEVSDAG